MKVHLKYHNQLVLMICRILHTLLVDIFKNINMEYNIFTKVWWANMPFMVHEYSGLICH